MHPINHVKVIAIDHLPRTTYKETSRSRDRAHLRECRGCYPSPRRSGDLNFSSSPAMSRCLKLIPFYASASGYAQNGTSRFYMASSLHGCGNSSARWGDEKMVADLELTQRAQTAPRGQFKNTLDIFRSTIRNEGVSALYKGQSPPHQPRIH